MREKKREKKAKKAKNDRRRKEKEDEVPMVVDVPETPAVPERAETPTPAHRDVELHTTAEDVRAIEPATPVAAVSPSRRRVIDPHPDDEGYQVRPEDRGSRLNKVRMRNGVEVPHDWWTGETAQRYHDLKANIPADRACVECGRTAPSDRAWTDHLKEHLWVVGCHCGYASRVRKNMRPGSARMLQSIFAEPRGTCHPPPAVTATFIGLRRPCGVSGAPPSVCGRHLFRG